MILSTNPSRDYEVIGQVDESQPQEIDEKIKLANLAKKEWKNLGVSKRIEKLKEAYDLFVSRRKELELMITQEVGKTIRESERELTFYLNYFKWFLDNGGSALEDETTFEDVSVTNKIVYEPYGVAGVITPWNLPFGMFVWGAIPNLIAGNVVVYKTSEECPLAGKFIEEIMGLANLPRGVFSEIYGASVEGQRLVNGDINLIWFTGSTEVGKTLYKVASEKFIKVVLEMGGSNPAILFEDADLEKFIGKIYSKRFNVCGQTCDALKRLIVQDSFFDVVVNRIKAEVESKVTGDPQDQKTDIGSLVSQRQLETLEAQVVDAINKGAKVVTGGKRPEGLKGAFYLPTVLTGVSRDMKVWREEVFGPVLSVVSFKTEEEAIELANDTKYGLGALIFSNDKELSRRVASQLDSGTVEINSGNHWLGCNPFGGYKESGMGREHGKEGFRELCQIKVISSEK